MAGGKAATSLQAPPRRFWGFEEWRSMMGGTSVLQATKDLYGEFYLLCGRDIFFTVTKFVIFDSLRESILFLLPSFAETESLLVACLCGAFAGAIAAFVSHPVDTLFALRAAGSDGDAVGQLPSLVRLFRGVGPRVLIYSGGIALQFLVYDLVKTFLGVGAGGLLQTLDLFGAASPP